MQRLRPETVTLDDVVITEELSRRSPRPPNLQAENQAMHTLARQLVNQPETMLQSLVEMALDLCQAGTTGVSLLEVTSNGEEVFGWNVLAGALQQYVGGTTPGNFSPCGTCLDRGAPQLYSHPERYFTYFQVSKTPIVEGLVLPLIADNHALGTIWIMSHDEQRHFDLEDVRVMVSLADFTAAALLLTQRQTKELLAANATLEAEIAERKQSEERLRESEERLSAIFALAAVGISEISLDGRFQRVNDEFCRVLRRSREDLLEAGVADVTHPDDVPKSLSALGCLVETGEPVSFDKRYLRPDGTIVWANSSLTRLDDEQGRPRMVLAVTVDLTDRKRAEEEHIQLIQEQAARLEAEQASRMKDEFLATISHELQSPLVAILGWTRLLRANPPAPAMLTKSLETIERNAILQAKLITDLLDISRITVGKLHLSLQPVELKSVIETAIASVSQTAQAKGIDLVWWGVTGQGSDALVHRNVDNVLMLGDRDRLQQIVCNLLTNAIKFTPELGSINVELSAIKAENSSNASYAEICITDTGIGIPAEFLPHVFERFRQVEHSGSSGGMGLGLAIARHLVELHGGTIHAESPGVGQGATFTIKLPLIVTTNSENSSQCLTL